MIWKQDVGGYDDDSLIFFQCHWDALKQIGDLEAENFVDVLDAGSNSTRKA
jgi:hypothetical protein